MNLSAKNGWLDEEGRVYIIFTIEEIKGALGCAEKKAVKLLDELEKKCGLIERKRQGLGKPNLIYVKNFISGSVERQFLNCQKDNSGVVKNTIQELSKAQGNTTDTNYIDFNTLSVSVDELLCDSLEQVKPVYDKKIAEELADCDAAELQAMLEIIHTTKTVIRKNRKVTYAP